MLKFFMRASSLTLIVFADLTESNSTFFKVSLEGTGNYYNYGPEKNPSVIWSFEAGAPLIATPLIFEENVYLVDLEGVVYALQKSSGNLIWEKDLDGEPGFQITLNESVLLVGISSLDGSGYGCLLALDRLTGEEKWRFQINGQTSLESPVIYVDQAYFTSMSDYLFSVDINTGKELWRFATEGGGQPLISEGVIYIQDDSQILYALSSESGEEYWRESSQGAHFSNFGVPAISDCCIFTIREEDDDWFLLEFDKNNGRVNNKVNLDYPSLSSVSLADNIVFIGDEGEGHSDSHGYMNAINMVTGERVWRYQTEGVVRASASIAGDIIFFGSYDRKMYAVDRQTGELKWHYETDASIASSPAVVDGRLYFSDISGRLYVLE